VNIIIGSDHAGFALKEALKGPLASAGCKVFDAGTHREESVDYPDYGVLAAEKVSSGRFERGILVCGSGVGMAIVANKFPGVRAACASKRKRRGSPGSTTIRTCSCWPGARRTPRRPRGSSGPGWKPPSRGGATRSASTRSGNWNTTLQVTQEGEETMSLLKKVDPEVAAAILEETKRQAGKLE
jgi:hypothetical protein